MAVDVAGLIGDLGLTIRQRSGDEVLADCHACGKERHLSINRLTGLWRCLVCGARGNPFQLVQQVTKDESRAVFNRLSRFGLAAQEKPGPSQHSNGDPFAAFAEAKRCSIESLRAYGARVEGDRLLIPMIAPDGKECSHQTFGPPSWKGVNAKGKPTGLFLPGRLPRPGDTWILSESVKDCAAAHVLGYWAAGTAGAQSFKAAFVKLFGGCDVLLVPHLDQAGQEGAAKTARMLHGIARSVRVLRLPGEFGNGGDLRDWLHSGAEPKGRDEADVLFETAVEWTPPPNAKAKINLAVGDLPAWTSAAWTALQKANDPPSIFRHGAMPVRIETDDAGAPIVRQLGIDRMRHHLARVALWTRAKTLIPPPKDVVRDVLATPDPALPILTRIVSTPVFAADGTLQSEPGYSPATQTYYVPAEGFSLPAVPETPLQADIDEARAMLRVDLLGEFPFVSDAERAHAMALTLLPYVREMIDGPTPLHLFEAPMPGTGKTLCATMAIHPALGRDAPAITEGRDEDEWRKRIFAKLRGGPSVVLIDNLRRRLDSAALSSAITAWPTWEDRILGLSEMASVPVRCVWIGTGNNPALSSEMARRTVRIRLDAKVDQPWLREGFTHPDLRGWTAGHRGQLVWAALTLIRAWIAAGRPLGDKTIGMFEAWAKTMGGILEVAGVPGFLGNLQEFYEHADAEGAALRSFVAEWWERHHSAPVGVNELWPIATESVGLDLGKGTERSQRTRLGALLPDHRDRVFSIDDGADNTRLKLESAGKRNRAAMWRLSRL
ncbi:MAG: hypothetical protein HY000_09625 [Planctomycetes bacterium]|nr:hypothetical protein [Planctomycetota bacterium]